MNITKISRTIQLNQYHPSLCLAWYLAPAWRSWRPRRQSCRLILRFHIRWRQSCLLHAVYGWRTTSSRLCSRPSVLLYHVTTLSRCWSQGSFLIPRQSLGTQIHFHNCWFPVIHHLYQHYSREEYLPKNGSWVTCKGIQNKHMQNSLYRLLIQSLSPYWPIPLPHI